VAPPAASSSRDADDVPGPLETRGRAIFEREQCGRCHTLFDVPDAAGPAVPPPPRLPQALDSRVGPDLGLEGHRHSDDWHAAHLYAPDVLVPGTRMPASRHLFAPGGSLPPQLNDDGQALVAWLQGLGRARRDVYASLRGADPEIPAPRPAPAAARREQGRRLYGLWCLPCHGETGDGRGPAASLLVLPPRDLKAGRFRFKSAAAGEPAQDADLFRLLTLGTGTGAAMPSFAFLDPEERWSLVLAVRDFCPSTRGTDLQWRPAPGAPAAGTAPADSAADAARGAGLYTAWGCAACHGPAGEGKPFDDRATRGDGEPVLRASDLRHSCARRGGGSPAAFERALRHGVGAAMPSFAAVLERDPEGARAILAWLEGPGATAPGAPARAAKATPPAAPGRP
jgi:mono/diheme cytochrome c family protein